MEKLTIIDGITFDDVLLMPESSDVLPGDVVTSSSLSSSISLQMPIISAAMDTVTEAPVAICMALHGGMGIIHKNLSHENQTLEISKVKQCQAPTTASLDAKGRLLVGVAVGVGDTEFIRAEKLINAGADVIVVDTAHGHSKGVIDMVARLRTAYLNMPLIAGNIATAEAANALIDAGASALKVGIGPGSICTTRIVAGCGVPQLTAISLVASAARDKKIPIISDGGIKYSGDIIKAFAAGADIVMIGSLFAGTDESPGDLIECDGEKFKEYRGMGSIAAMKKGSKDRYFQGDVQDEQKLVPEGVEGRVPYRGPLSDILYQLVGGLRSGMGYVGCRTISEINHKARFIRISNAGLRESHVHDIAIAKKAPNY